jgi:hypothetical protein
MILFKKHGVWKEAYVTDTAFLTEGYGTTLHMQFHVHHWPIPHALHLFP